MTLLATRVPACAPDGPPACAPAIGVVMLDTRFPRPPGDIGHADTFCVPVRRRVVEAAWPRRVVASAAALQGSGLLPRFEQAVRELAAAGAQVITTSCGFLVLLQRELQAVAEQPVLSSALLLLPELLRAEPRVGVLTIDAAALGTEHLHAAGVSTDRLGDVCVQGMDPQGEFARTILGNLPAWDAAVVHADVLAAAQALRVREPGLTTLVLECTNLPPYAADIARATGWRVLSLLDLPALRGLVQPAFTAAHARS